MQKILLHLPFSVLSLESCVLLLLLLSMVAEPFNTNVLQHLHQRIMITYTTYLILILLCRLLSKEIENPSKTLKTVGCRLRTENLNDYLTSQIQQVMPFSPFHCASNVPQTKKRRALSAILTHSNKTETAYQVMRDIAENGCTYTPDRRAIPDTVRELSRTCCQLVQDGINTQPTLGKMATCPNKAIQIEFANSIIPVPSVMHS